MIRYSVLAGLVWFAGCGSPPVLRPEPVETMAKRQDAASFAICATGPAGGFVTEWCRYRCDFDRDGDVDLFDWSKAGLE